MTAFSSLLPLASRFLSVLQFCLILRATSFGWVTDPVTSLIPHHRPDFGFPQRRFFAGGVNRKRWPGE